MILRLTGLILIVGAFCITIFGYGYALHVLFHIPYMQATKMSLVGILLGLVLMLFIVDLFFSVEMLKYKQERENESRQESYTTPD